jgi:hypothetical protein
VGADDLAKSTGSGIALARRGAGSNIACGAATHPKRQGFQSERQPILEGFARPQKSPTASTLGDLCDRHRLAGNRHLTWSSYSKGHVSSFPRIWNRHDGDA